MDHSHINSSRATFVAPASPEKTPIQAGGPSPANRGGRKRQPTQVCMIHGKRGVET